MGDMSLVTVFGDVLAEGSQGLLGDTQGTIHPPPIHVAAIWPKAAKAPTFASIAVPNTAAVEPAKDIPENDEPSSRWSVLKEFLTFRILYFYIKDIDSKIFI